MERTENGQKTKRTFTAEILRYMFYVFVVIFLVSCNVFLFLKQQQIEQRLAAIDDRKMDKFEEWNLKKHSPTQQYVDNDRALDAKALLVRKKRAPSLSLQSLEKRLKVLEFRALRDNKSTPSYELSAKESCNGRNGPDGRDGPTGPPGPPGIPGQPGTPGTAGIPGTQGMPGRDGREGRKGLAGPQGLPGSKGDIGPSGTAGTQGPSGPKGQKGQEGQGLSGVKYVRWGRTSCSGDAQIVYTGFIGSGHYSNTGGGANHLCLPNQPKYGKYTNSFESTGAIYGAEYEVSSFNPFKRHVHNHDAPCVVCYVRSRGAQLMMPARDDCPNGWTKEYHGYLMTEHWDHKKPRDFICVDGDPESVPGSHSNHNGALLYPVQANCGYFSTCPPYYEGRELTCAVCTK